MPLKFYCQKAKMLFLFFMLTVSSISAQKTEEGWKLQLSLGVNNPIEDDVKSAGYYSKYANFPTINLGVQYNFSSEFGAKFDVGFNKANNAEGSNEFTLNYTRFNAQLIYDFSSLFPFLPEDIATNIHTGPGYSISKPMGQFSENEYRFLNGIVGFDLHYYVSRTISLYTDLSYVHSFSRENKYDLNIDGFSFNKDLVYLAFGVAYSFGGSCTCSYL